MARLLTIISIFLALCACDTTVSINGINSITSLKIVNYPQGINSVTSLNVSVVAEDFTHYYYKLENITTIDCDNQSGYVGPIAISSPIADDIETLPDGEIGLCVYGSNISSLNSKTLDAVDTNPSYVSWGKDAKLTEISIETQNFVIDEDQGMSTITFSLNNPKPYDVQFEIDIFGDALAGVDYNLGKQIITIPKNQTSANLNIPILDNGTIESDRTLVVGLNLTPSVSAHANVAVGGQADLEIRIRDDDGGPKKQITTIATDCIIDSNNELSCWGKQAYGLLANGISVGTSAGATVIDSGTDYPDVITGDNTRCAITTAGKLRCWGYNSWGSVGDGSTSTRLTTTPIDATENYSFVTMGRSTTCAITTSNVLKCWGTNFSGAVGVGSSANIFTSPQIVDSGTNYTTVSVSYGSSACAITTGNTLKCWGNNSLGQLGTGDTTNSNLPVTIDSGTLYKDVIARSGFTCGLTMSNTVKCWGQNATGLGFSDTDSSLIPREITGLQFNKIYGDTRSICAKTDGNQFYCWGSFASHGKYITSLTPSLVFENLPFSNIRGVGYNDLITGKGYCGIDSDGDPYCWGTSNLGHANTVYAFAPQTIDPNDDYKYVDTGNYNTCAISTSNQLKCWGRNTYGNIGDGTQINRSYPKVIDPGVEYLKVSVGQKVACGVTSNNVLKCWGGYGENPSDAHPIGNGTTTGALKPTVIDSGTLYSDIEVSNTICGITVSNTLKCWGLNEFGAGGVGHFTALLTPNIVDNGIGYTEITKSSSSDPWESFCAKTLSNTWNCWGMLFFGQGFLDASTHISTTPGAFNTSKSFQKVVPGGTHVCGLNASQTIECVGYDTAGQLGDGGGAPSNSIGLVDFDSGSGNTYSDLKLGAGSSCGLRSDNGEIRCAGSAPVLGANTSPQDYDPGQAYISFSIGAAICGITPANKLRCGGNGQNGQLGVSSNGATPSLVKNIQ